MVELTYEMRPKADQVAFVATLSGLEGVEYATLVEYSGDYYE